MLATFFNINENDETAGGQAEDNKKDKTSVDEDNLSLEDIDFNALSPVEKILYKEIQKQNKQAFEREIATAINASGLTENQTKIINRMAKNGVGITEILETIGELKEESNKANRNNGLKGTLLPKSKIKFTTVEPKETVKLGSRDFGVQLANKLKRK